MRVRRLDTVFLAVLVMVAPLTGCREPRPSASESIRPAELVTPAPPDSGEPNLAVAPDGAVLLSWIEPSGEDAVALRHARREVGGSWSAPRTVATGDDWFVNWADFPSLAALPDGTLFAHWLKKSGPATFAYDVQMALSRDAGVTWSEPVVPHRDGTQTEHGFVSMAPLARDRMGVVWLDGRHTARHDDDPSPHGGGDAATALMFASIDDAGELSEETQLDARVCDCCQTGMVRTDPGLLVVYRDRSESEVRDISFIRFDGERWSRPRDLSPDGWEIHGCPVNGPSVAARGSRVAVAWFTAAGDQGRVNVILSDDGGESWGAPVRVDHGEPLGRVDVGLRMDGDALVSWLEQVEGETHLEAQRVGLDGLIGPPLRIADSSASRSSGFPRLAVSSDEAVFAWRDRGEPPRVRSAVLRLN